MTHAIVPARLALPLFLFLGACRAPAPQGAGAGVPPVPGAVPVDHLIRPGEARFARLWQVTSGGENAEAYWSFDGRRLSLQRRAPEEGIECDRIYVTSARGLQQVSTGEGTTTCAYFLPDGRRVLFASTHGEQEDCPPSPDFSEGYVWAIHPEFDIWSRDLEGGELRPLITGPGYDAEATVSPTGDRIVFTSTRSGDLELWTAALDGTDLVQVTDRLGYDGGAFFSHDGTRLVFRSTGFDPEKLEEEQATYRALLDEWKVRPHTMELWLVEAGGGNLVQLTDLGSASFAPSFFPGDRRVIFSSNFQADDPSSRNFDLYAIDVEGGELERITFEPTFDSFPLFSPDGRYLAFSSNRGAQRPGETNVFIAEWRWDDDGGEAPPSARE